MNFKSIKRGASHCLDSILTMCTLSCIFGYNTDKLFRQLRYRMDIVKQNLKTAIENERRLYRDIFICQFDLEYLHAKYEDCQINLQYIVEDLSSVRNRKWKKKFQKEVFKVWGLLLKHQQPIKYHLNIYRECYFQGFEETSDSGMSSCSSSITSINELPCSPPADPPCYTAVDEGCTSAEEPIKYFSQPGSNDDGSDEYAELWDERANELFAMLGI